MRSAFLSLLLIFVLNNILSQEAVIEYHQGLGRYSMTDLKGLNEVVMESLPFNTKLVADFPIYWYYRPGVSMKYKRFEFGCIYHYQSTGSRISVKDYSGDYHFDTKVNSHAPGIKLGFIIINKELLKIKMYSNGGIVFSKLKMKEFLKIYEQSLINEGYSFSAQNYYLEPGITISYPFKFLDLAINLGYNLQFGGLAFHAQNNKDLILQNQRTSNPIKPDWTGVRIGLSVSYSIKIKD